MGDVARADDNDAEFCQSCGAHFPDDPNPLYRVVYFRVCGECWHCWPTADDLVDHDYRLHVEMSNCGDPVEFWNEIPTPPRRRPVEDIFSCPCCAHDF